MPKGQPHTTTIRIREDTLSDGSTVYAVILPAQKIDCEDLAHALAAQTAIVEAINDYTMNEAVAEEV